LKRQSQHDQVSSDIRSKCGVPIHCTCCGLPHPQCETRDKTFTSPYLVPTWLLLSPDFVVLASGVVEISLGLALISLQRRREVGIATALFFIAIFPGNISQYVNHIDAFGLDSDRARGIRLIFQPLLVLWALWGTGALKSLLKR